MDNHECLHSTLISSEVEHFQKLDTVIIASTPLAIGVIIEIIGIIFISLRSKEYDKCESYFIVLYLHCGYWFVIMIVDHVIKSRHHDLRICGYLEFYQSTYQQIRTPLFISSLWNTMYLLLSIIFSHTHTSNFEDYCHSSEWFTPVNYILLFTTLELIIIIPVYLNYIKRVRQFNQLRPLPDVIKEEWLANFAHNSYTNNTDVGCHEKDSNFLELLEKQADLIRYLRDHNVKLSHRMMLLASERYSNDT